MALRVKLSSSEAAFVALMNERAREFGLANTRFANACGFDAPAHHASAADLATLAQRVIADPGLGRLAATHEHTAVDRSGRDPEGSEIRAFPGRNEVLRGAFATDVGVENDPIQLGADGFVWFDVQNVTRARDRTLEEAKDRVLAAWRDEQAAARVKTKADEIVQRVKAGTKLAAVAEAEQFAVSTATVQRAGTKELPPAAVAAVFTTAVGGATSAAGDDAVSRVVLQVTDSKLPDSSAEAATVSAELRRGLEDDLIAEHVARLENDLGVKINRSALDQIVGREGGQ